MVVLRCCDFEFKENYLSIQIRKSKADVQRSGNEILVSKGTSSAYTILQKYMTKACSNTSSEKYLFRPIFRSGKLCKLFLLKRIVNRFKRAGYSLDIMRQTACLVFNTIIVEGYAALFSCTAVVQASDSITASM